MVAIRHLLLLFFVNDGHVTSAFFRRIIRKNKFVAIKSVDYLIFIADCT